MFAMLAATLGMAMPSLDECPPREPDPDPTEPLFPRRYRRSPSLGTHLDPVPLPPLPERPRLAEPTPEAKGRSKGTRRQRKVGKARSR